MSDTITTGVPGGTAELPPAPVTNPYQELANELIAFFLNAATRIPHFQAKHRSNSRFVRTYAKYPNGFIVTTLAAVATDPELRQTNRFNVDEALDALRYNEAFVPLADIVFTFATNLKFSCDSKKAKPVADGLQIYAIAKGLGRDLGGASAAAHVENMKRDLNLAGGRRKSKTKEDPTKPTTTNTVQ
jgi:hypothetical protein